MSEQMVTREPAVPAAAPGQATATRPATATAPAGRVLQVNVSPGGVPKLPVSEARVRRLGLDGDGHSEPTAHGGPHRAVSLFAIEAIRRVAAEGHPIGPGTAGENLTIAGIELSALPVGSRLAIGEELVLEVSAPDNPCATIRRSFADGRFGRIGIASHPLDSRMYARVLREGIVRPGDPIAVLPAEAGARAAEQALLARLDAANAASSLAQWRALAASGVDLRIVDDNEVALVAEPGVRGGWWNCGLGFGWLPNMARLAVDHFRTNAADGWIELDPADEETAGIEPIVVFDMLAASPDDVLAGAGPGGAAAADAGPLEGPGEVEAGPLANPRAGSLSIGAIDASGAARWAGVLAAVEGMPAELLDRWTALARNLADAPHATLLLAELDGRAVGAAALHTHRRVGWLRTTAVLPDARGHGIHRALVAERARLALEAGCDLLGAQTEPGGRSAANLASMGFRRIGARGRYPAAAFAGRRDELSLA